MISEPRKYLRSILRPFSCIPQRELSISAIFCNIFAGFDRKNWEKQKKIGLARIDQNFRKYFKKKFPPKKRSLKIWFLNSLDHGTHFCLFRIEKIFFLRKVTPPQSQKVAENAGFGSTLIHMRYIYIYIYIYLEAKKKNIDKNFF